MFNSTIVSNLEKNSNNIISRSNIIQGRRVVTGGVAAGVPGVGGRGGQRRFTTRSRSSRMGRIKTLEPRSNKYGHMKLSKQI